MIHPQAQRLLIEMKSAGYAARGKDVVIAQRFTVATHMNVIDQGITYVPINAKCDALYPFIGNSLVSQKFNLINPALYSINFVGPPTPSDCFMPWNGTSEYGDIGIAGSVYAGDSSIHQSYNSLTNDAIYSVANRTKFDIGTIQTGPNYMLLQSKYYVDGTNAALRAYTSGAAINFTFPKDLRSDVISTVTRNGTAIKGYRDGDAVSSNTTPVLATAIPSNINLARGLWTTPINGQYSDRSCGGASFGSYMNDTEVKSHANAFALKNSLV